MAIFFSNVSRQLEQLFLSQGIKQIGSLDLGISQSKYQKTDRKYSDFWSFSKRCYSSAPSFPFGAQGFQETSRVLDLSSKRIKIDKNSLSALLDWMKLSNEGKGLLRIQWGTAIQKQFPDLYLALGRQLEKNKKAYRDRPSYGECAIFSNLAYESPEEIEKNKMLPAGWEILKEKNQPIYWDDRHDDSYYGTAFINKEQRFGIIGHRGTEFAFNSFKAVQELYRDLGKADLFEIFGNRVGDQQNSALEFSKAALKALKNQGCQSIGFVGHSLGGWLAQVSSYHLIAEEGEKNLFAATLDNPGSSRMIQQVAYRDRSNRISLTNLDFSSFVSYPNLVNTCHEHEGEVFHIRPDVTFSFAAKYISYLKFTLDAHDRKLQARVFDTPKGHPLKERTRRADSWPCLSYAKIQNELKQFFNFAKPKNDFQPETMDFNDRNVFWLRNRAHFRIKEYDPSVMRISHFTPEAQAFLLELNEIQKYEPNILSKCEKELGIEKGTFKPLSELQIIQENQKIEVRIDDSSSEIKDAYELRRQVSLLLEAYPELITYVQFPTLFQEMRQRTIEVPFLQEFRSQLSNQQDALKTLMDITAMGPVQRLYLYFRADESGINQHEKDSIRVEQFLQENRQLKRRISEFSKDSKPSLGAQKDVKRFLTQLENQKYQLEVALLMNKALKNHKMIRYDEAAKFAGEAFDKLSEFKDWASQYTTFSFLNFPILFSRICSLRAKISRAQWDKGETHLAESMKRYEEALKYYQGDSTPYSNLGALLNDWGEWLASDIENPDLKVSAEKQAEALRFHEQAYEINPVSFAVIRDYGRAIFLNAQSKFRLKKISKDEYQKELEKATACIQNGRKSSQEDHVRYNPTALHFLGLIELEQGDLYIDINKEKAAIYFIKALEHFSKGLKTHSAHPILLYLRALARFKVSKMSPDWDKDALKKGEKDLRSAISFFEGRRRITPEDAYRIERAKKLLKEITNG
ncbi:hypothetical protein [Candidatus Neptunochlamydia vexilliferae]|nr:hypothetical protein [Candidatus Neptunochlamydia vexilliferae]